MSIYASKCLQAIQEVYFGETPGIQKIQQQLSKFRANHIGKEFDPYVNLDPELLKLNRMFEDEFGFEVFSLTVIKQSIYNAFTMPIGYKLDSGNTASKLTAGKEGFKYSKDAGYATTVCIYSGILNNPDFTDREILAIILHEVGHNFSGAVNKSIGVLHALHKIILVLVLVVLLMQNFAGPFMAAIALITIVNLNMFEKFCAAMTKQFVSKYPKVAQGLEYVDAVFAKIHDAMNEVDFITQIMLTPTIVGAYGKAIMNTIVNTGGKLIMNPALLFKKIHGYSDEQFSDNFAALYGYGPDLLSALGKMNYSGHGRITEEAINKIPIFSHLFNLIWLPVELIVSIFDEHPNAPARIQNELQLLEAELKKEKIDPKLRDRLKHDINIINRDYEKLYTNLNEVKEPFLFKKLYYAWLYKRCGGDLKHLINKINTPEAIDQGYDTAIAKAKMK